MTTRKLTIAEFESLLERNDWQREQWLEVVANIKRPVYLDDEILHIPHTYGCAEVKHSLDGMLIFYKEVFSYDDYDADSLSASTEGLSDVWAFLGFEVVDEDGDTVDPEDYMPEAFSTIDYSELRLDQTTDVDVDEDSDMETFTLEIDNAPDIRFTGELIARTRSYDDRARGSYSGETGRWTELLLYKTAGGKYICHQIGRTRWQGERDRFSGQVCETLDEVKEFFGHRWLAKELYAEAGIEDVMDVE